MSTAPYVTVVETSPFIEDAERCFSPAQREDLIEFVACNPRAGVVIPGAGGVRKLRWRALGRGKRGGARVIYYFHSEQMPIFLLTAYTKSWKTDLSPTERHGMRGLIADLVAQYQPRVKSRRRGTHG